MKEQLDNPFGNFEFRVLPTLDKVAGFIGRVVSLGTTTELCLSEHKSGAAEMLDQHLDAQPELPFGDTIQPVYLTDAQVASELRLRSGWDDCGNYTSFVEGSRS